MTKANPLDTPEQREHEKLALELIGHPIVRAAYGEVRDSWLEMAAPSAAMRSCFEAAFEEVMFSAAVWSLNQDPLRPKVIVISRLEHQLDGVRVPGSRWGIDNPDSIYRVIPISGSERYVIRGRVAKKRMDENYFTLWNGEMDTVANFNAADLQLADDRTFEISVDSDPADGRPNHIRSTPDAREFYIRDVIQDWERDAPNQLSVERLGGPPAEPPRSDDEQAELTASFMRRYARSTHSWISPAQRRPANQFQLKIDRDTGGALRNQIYLLGRFEIGEQDALIVRVQLGGARYFVAPITNLWGTTNEIMSRTSSLNLAQSLPDEDGALTLVMALRDPGAHNWLDPCDMGEGMLTLRWAEFPGGRPGADLSVTSRVAPFAKLRDELPAGTRFVTPQERAQQIARRAAGYARRLSAHG